uniref:Acyl-CoA-binding domain-containing protein 7 isoform X2 n=1 Tax=Geotrypetes seraphini TaxID=260995 RepID=A0A6P8PRE0_GEOSA|nr:acyl-CoA-binding domain-containing protein 7 isoform X2 [Geotrypetes seraphini]
MSLEVDFKKAADDVRKLKSKPADDEMSEVYSLYKQSVVGDVNKADPGAADELAKNKWDAWNKKKGMSKDDAMKAYIVKSKEMAAKYGVDS